MSKSVDSRLDDTSGPEERELIRANFLEKLEWLGRAVSSGVVRENIGELNDAKHGSFRAGRAGDLFNYLSDLMAQTREACGYEADRGAVLIFFIVNEFKRWGWERPQGEPCSCDPLLSTALLEKVDEFFRGGPPALSKPALVDSSRGVVLGAVTSAVATETLPPVHPINPTRSSVPHGSNFTAWALSAGAVGALVVPLVAVLSYRPDPIEKLCEAGVPAELTLIRGRELSSFGSSERVGVSLTRGDSDEVLTQVVGSQKEGIPVSCLDGHLPRSFADFEGLQPQLVLMRTEREARLQSPDMLELARFSVDFSGPPPDKGYCSLYSSLPEAEVPEGFNLGIELTDKRFRSVDDSRTSVLRLSSGSTFLWYYLNPNRILPISEKGHSCPGYEHDRRILERSL